MRLKKRFAVLGAIISLGVAALIIPQMIGAPARLVDLIALLASGVAAGASLAAALRKTSL